jgi:nitrite reductase/ring-hydroxylating ferredoxin subunit
MLSATDNDLLTKTGPGTPMGDYFRRFWIPVLLSRELPEPDGAPVRVTVMGEELVAFRDTRGRVGLLDPRCPHRGADLFFGRNEECGLRCVLWCSRHVRVRQVPPGRRRDPRSWSGKGIASRRTAG